MGKEIIVTVKTDTKQTDTKLNKVNQNLKKTEKQAKETGTAMSSAFSRLPGPIQGAANQIKSLGTSFKAIAVGAGVGAIAGLGSLFVTATKRGAEFAQSLSGLEAVLGASETEMKQLSNSAKELGASTQFTSKQVVELQTEFAKLGFSTKEILASTKATLDLAASLDVGLGEAAAIAGSTLRAFGLEAEETQRVVDVMASSTSKSALDYEALRESLKLVAPTSRAMNVSIEETTALLATLADNGLKGSVAGTGLSKTFIELNKEGIPLKEALDRVKNSSNQLNTAIDLVGVVGAKSLLTLANNAPKIDRLTTAFENSQGAAQRLAETRLDNLAGDTTKLSSAWEGFLLSIEDGTGVFNRIARGIVQAATSFLNFLTPVNELSDSLIDQQVELFETESRLIDLDKVINDTTTSEEDLKKAQEDRKTIIEELQKKYPDYLGNIDAEKTSTEDLQKALSKVNEELVNRIIIQQQQEEIEEAAEELAEARIDKAEMEVEIRREIAELEAMAARQGVEVKIDKRLPIANQLMQATEEVSKLENSFKSLALSARIRESFSEYGRTLYNETSATEDLNEANKLRDDLLKQLGISLDDYNKKVETNNEFGSKNNELTGEGNNLLEDGNEALGETIEKETDLIKLLEQELKTVSERKATSELEIAQRNDEAKAIRDKIKALKDLSLEYIKDSETQIPLMEKRGAVTGKIEKTATKTTKEETKKQKDALKDLEDNRSMLLQRGLDNLIATTEAESKVNKAALVAKHIIMAQELIMEASKTVTFSAQVAARSKAALVEGKARTAKVGFPQNIPLLIGYGLQAAGIIMSLKNALKAAKAPINIPELEDNTGAGGGATTETQAPEFNVVGQSGINQIAGAFAGRGPIQAFVVSGDVTTAQQLQNNTIQQATF